MKMRRMRCGLCAHGATGGSMRAVCCQTIGFHHKTLTSCALTATDPLQDKGQSAKLVLNSFFVHIQIIILLLILYTHTNLLTHTHTQFLSFKLRLFSLESCLKCYDVKGRGGGG